ncbi:cysteine--tRNA ligase [Candidatus Gracilibacteria bacterium]|nr:cysteine--tRNA ligase [Candidatus Gracilibacteria bacterium]
MSLHLYNTLTRELERFKPLKQEEVKVYYCGPTPYNYAHIGNLRNYLMDDIVVRTLRFLGYKVRTVMNVTDIDDKTIRESQKSGKTLQEFTEFYTEKFMTDCVQLSIFPADIIAPISTLIPDMGAIIDGLIAKGYAYLAEDGSIYYSVAKFKKYGQLAHLDMKGMISSVRINNDEYDKEQVADFALWKAYDSENDGENAWEIEVVIDGDKKIIKGRPGWHIECSACNIKFFGAQIDIHMGGCDLIFPHHQNEVAQTEAYTGKQFAQYWMHGGHLLVDNKKMSKSANNFYTLQDIFKKNSDISEVLIRRGFRLMALQNQYRENFNFTFERLGAAINTIKGLDEMIRRLGRYQTTLIGEDIDIEGLEDLRERNAKGRLKFHEISREFRDNQQSFIQEFIERLEDDFDTLGAMTIVFEYQTYINTSIDDALFSLEECKSIIDFLKTWNEVIAIFDFELLQNNEIIPKEMIALLAERNEAKLNKNYAVADRIRDTLDTMGYKIIDEKNGARIEKKK